MAIEVPPICSALQTRSADCLLRGISSKQVRDRFRAERLKAKLAKDQQAKAPAKFMHAIHEGEDALDRLGPNVGLTVSVKDVKILDDQEDFFGGSSEIYIVTSLLDGSGRVPDFKTKVFEGMSDGARLPLGSGGMLVGMLKNPRWFVDMHMVIMESDADIRSVGQAIEKARKDSGLNDLVKAVGALASFDPTAISQVTGAVDVFLTLLSGLLKANDDDHIATVHDFYLKSQAFGAARHPTQGRHRFQSAEVAYQIDLVRL